MEELYDILDRKAEEYKAKGHKLLSDQINEIKEEQY